MRRPIIAGNWKMFKTIPETRSFFDALIPEIQNVEHCDVVVAPPFTALAAAVEETEGTRVAISALIVAYEPVWAIGTGRTATPEIAAEMHAEIRSILADIYGAATADTMRILYGGSVKPDNISALMKKEDIDGALVGGASLDPASFAAIVKYI